ncbi:MAG: IgGFc-binding protein [Myxococcales bacterium]|nr:IgGFc-binding protein [Myxococcales bacterium]MCB9626320.1 IgGFc-binding protein [Sandaracinaceae bacterium]
MTLRLHPLLLVLFTTALCGCGAAAPAQPDAGPVTGFVCERVGQTGCDNGAFVTCVGSGTFLRAERDECGARGEVCVASLGCRVCVPDLPLCEGTRPGVCRADGSGVDLLDACDAEQVCSDGQCVNACELAERQQSYVGCEFFAIDLDNAALGGGRDASSQQFAVVVSNPGLVPSAVVVEVNDAAPGAPVALREVASAVVLPGDLEVFELARREVDGSSSNAACDVVARECRGAEVCVCSAADTVAPCFCRVSAQASGQNDGTHTAITSNAYRLVSDQPIIAYQFNPLDNVSVFSNDASLLLPASALTPQYTVVSWPQTIADSDCPPEMPCPEIDFDTSSRDEGLRAFLTIVGTEINTQVSVTLGPDIVRVLPGSGVPMGLAGDELTATLGPFDVLNLETAGFMADFTGSFVSASRPVGVFVGSEASDAPMFTTYANRQCCADHLEEQLFGDGTLGSQYVIARMPGRAASLNAAFVDTTLDSVAVGNEVEYVRVVAIRDATEVTTTLPAPDDRFTLDARESRLLSATRDFEIFSTLGRPVSVLQALPSQQAVGIPSSPVRYPGGDPSLIMVPPVEQYRREYVFLTPDRYAFDYVVIVAPRTAEVRLDGVEVVARGCSVSPADGLMRGVGELPPERVIYRCQLSFPEVERDLVRPGVQADGVHRLVANAPVGIVVYGFDAFVSYAYAGGLNLQPLFE